MFIFFLSYIVTMYVTTYIVQKLKYKTKPIPKLKVTKFGIEFFSNQKHKIEITNAKIIKTDESIFLKVQDKIILIRNVKNLVLRNEHIYFCANGSVRIIFDCSTFYKYFNICIKSNDINFEELKQIALLELLNNNFDVSRAKKFKKFLNFIKNTLKIEINKEKIKVFANNLNLSYLLVYKMNNKIKQINIVNSIGKN